MTRAVKPFINLADVRLKRLAHDPGFEAMTGSVTAQLGAKMLGCRLVVVPPGRKAWPYHSHHANEELFVILAGEGKLRYGGEIYDVRQGDVVACPVGGADTAHQLINTSQGELRYLAISTMHDPDVTEYPDSGKFGVLSGSPPGGDKNRRHLTFFGRHSDNLDYFDGES